MSGKERRHQGVQIVADFKDRAIPLGEADGACSPAPPRRSANEGIQPLADVQNAALKASVIENGRVIDRYHLGGPNEDEI